jgi:hypothetical protein
MTTYYFNGAINPVTEEAWRTMFYNSFTPLPSPNDGSDDEFPDILGARVAILEQHFGMMLRAELMMQDGSVPPDLEQYTFRTLIYGNNFPAKFMVENGIAFAEWGMGKEGWEFIAEDGRDVGLCVITRDDGNWEACDAVKGIGWFPSEDDGHTQAKMTWVITPAGHTTHELKLHAVGSGWIEGVAGPYHHGDRVPLKAHPLDGNRFVQWDITVGSQITFLFEPVIEIDILDDTIVLAQFEPDVLPGPNVELAKKILKEAHVLAEQLRGQIARAKEALGVQ